MDSGIEKIRKFMEDERREIQSRIEEKNKLINLYIERRHNLLENMKDLRREVSSELRSSVNKKKLTVEMQELNRRYHETSRHLMREKELIEDKIDRTSNDISSLEEELNLLQKKIKSIQKYIDHLSLERKKSIEKRGEKEIQDYLMANYEGKKF